MKRLVGSAAVLAVLLGAASAVNATPFVGQLSGPAEAPPNASPGTGSFSIDLDLGAHLLRVSTTFSGLLSPTAASHIHCCVAAPGTAPVATAVPTFLNFPLGVTSGTYDATFDTLLAATYNPAFVAANGSVAGAEAALFAGLSAGQAYLNVHTTLFPAGEIRGFATAVPAPATLALLVAGVAGAGMRRRPRPA